MDAHRLTAEVERNYDFFQRSMSGFLPDHYREYALLRHCEVVGFFADAGKAEERGETFADGLYSIQLVDPEPVNLGLYSNG
ncbi:MAG: hypothetical protein M3Q57_09625 [Pseudomonadota bacterium]|nr:hypothetical protein [Pseudomonadota bacterium]